VTLVVAGIPVVVSKKKINNMHLYVKPPHGSVIVSAPLSMSDEAIERFVRTKVGWIRKQILKFDDQLRQSDREYVSGETFYVLGKQFYMQVEYAPKNSLILHGDKAVLTVRKGSTKEQRGNFVREWYRKLLIAEIERLLPIWERRTGLEATSWQTKYMTTHWGTCNRDTGKIWLNVQLAKKIPECLEYIVLHELVHLEEKNHNERFISLMDKHMPNWREVRKTLNGQALDYME